MDKHSIRSIMLKEKVQGMLYKCYTKSESVSTFEIMMRSTTRQRISAESDRDAMLLVFILARITEYLSYDQFNNFWWQLSDGIYTEEADDSCDDEEEDA